MTFDWVTFGFQLVNILVLLAILRRFLFRPVVAVIARRQAETEATLAAAGTARAEAEAEARRARAEAEATAAARHDLLDKARAEAEAARATLLDQARAEAAKIVAEGAAAREREAGAARAEALGRARDLASVIAARAFEAQPPGLSGYVARLTAALDALSPEERSALLGGGHPRLAAPAPLPPADLDAARAAFARFGVTPGTETDPALIAGLEFRSDTGAVRNSLAHDLDRIAEALRDDRAA
ncbi:F0F1 ATP synthase subunit B family protein [Amaricoccus solimangrovi]|uniref:ATP synthase subunit b n=1 Tax=Amaricoccus solimangrovi TaxID=2589815 RepID=A0A501WZR1_9RHOB|nr:ATPase [Amaricoccus solimangrovi]TPE53915.1 ATPase [Amaricoccus solimangrovi]